MIYQDTNRTGSSESSTLIHYTIIPLTCLYVSIILYDSQFTYQYGTWSNGQNCIERLQLLEDDNIFYWGFLLVFFCAI